jgi:hypothetical protein
MKIYVLQPNSNANVYIIKSKDDVEYLYKKFNREKEVYSSRINNPPFDFEKISKKYDGLQLKNNKLLDGWDVESTLWFNWSFKSVEKIPRKDCYIDNED